MLSYPIKFRKGADGLIATCPDFPEVALNCNKRSEGLERAIEALEAAIAVRISFRREVPEPSGGHRRAALTAQSAIKVRLYQAARESGVTRRELGRRLKWHGPQVDRLFNIKHASRLAQLDAAFHALGLQLNVDVDSQRARLS